MPVLAGMSLLFYMKKGFSPQVRAPAYDWRMCKPNLGNKKAFQVVAGKYHSCALLEDSRIKCWANDRCVGLETNFLKDDETVAQIAVKGENTCVLLKSAKVKCRWGSLKGKECIPNLRAGIVSQIAVGEKHSYALVTERNKSVVKQWDDSCYSGKAPVKTVDFLKRSSRPITQIVAGYRHFCAILKDNQFICRGNDMYGQFDIPDLGEKNIFQIVAGYRHTCAILEDSQLICWGDNTYGKVSLPNLEAKRVAQVTAGYGHTCGLFSGGSFKCWGWDMYRQIGSELLKGQVITQIAAGYGHTCAILGGVGISDGDNVRCWGGSDKYDAK